MELFQKHELRSEIQLLSILRLLSLARYFHYLEEVCCEIFHIFFRKKLNEHGFVIHHD